MLRSSSTTSNFSITASPSLVCFLFYPDLLSQRGDRFFLRLGCASRSLVDASRLRELDRNLRALPGLAVHNDVAVVIPDKLIDDRHSKTRSSAGRVERLKQPLPLLPGHSLTRVSKADRHLGARTRIDRDSQLASMRHGLYRVSREVPEDLSDLVRIAVVVDRQFRTFVYDLVIGSELRTVSQ